MNKQDKTIYFIAGLPRSGSTLLANVLYQNPRFYVTPTSGIIDLLIQVRNHWDKNDAFRAQSNNFNEMVKKNVLQAMFQSYFEHTDRPVCIDKNRFWPEYLEMAEALIGDRSKIKVLVTVRDLRDVAASFEKLFRHTSALGQLPQDAAQGIKFKKAESRVALFVDDTQPIGRAYIAIRDAVTRGWLKNMLFIDYKHLTANPEKTLHRIYKFLGEDYYNHDFNNVEQLTVEDDSAYGFKDLHQIRSVIKPQKEQWPLVFDDMVIQSPVWKNLEGVANFWKQY